MSTKSKFKNGILNFYESGTQEIVAPLAPVYFYDDFVGSNAAIPSSTAMEAGMFWSKLITSASTVSNASVAYVADAANGQVSCTLTTEAEVQHAMLYCGNQRNFSLLQGCVFEARVNLAVLPTSNSEVAFGLIGDASTAGPDGATYSAFFTADGSGELICEMDDNSTDYSATSSVTATTAQWKVCRIDASDYTNVKFYIDGNPVATGTTFNYGATGADAVLQPFIAAYSTSGTVAASIIADYVRVWQKRS